MKIVALVGSIREESYNRKLAKFIQERYSTHFELDIVPIKQLPFYHEDSELNPPLVVTEFKQKIKEAHAVLFITPEYNYSLPGVLKNAIDWLSRVDKVLIGKPAWIIGASKGLLGTVRAQLHLREILFSPGVSCNLLPGNEVYLSTAPSKFNNSGQLIDEATIDYLDKGINHFLRFVLKSNK